MALRKLGRVWHIYYRGLDGVMHTMSTGETNRRTALARERVFMAQLSTEKRRRRRGSPVVTTESQLAGAGHNKLTFTRAWELFTLHVPGIPQNSEKNWLRFAKFCGCRFANEVTPQIAYAYLLAHYGEAAGKTWNNNLSSLNRIYSYIAIPADMPRSPFADIPSRPAAGEHQRPFTDDEIARIFAAAIPLWRAAVVIAYWTGFRKESCFRLGPKHISVDPKSGSKIITLLPGKTARFHRAVQIPLHPQLEKYLAALPPSADSTFLGFDQRQRHGGAFTRYFGELLGRLRIYDTPQGIVCFNSIRNTFISRCRAAQIIPDYALRGIVGQTSEQITDLYSRELDSALPLAELPPAQWIR